MMIARIYELTEDNLAKAPIGAGVYGLYKRSTRVNELIYIGGSLASVRDRLQGHVNDNREGCTDAATHFSCIATSAEDVRSRQSLLIAEFEDTLGRLPRCNDPRRSSARRT